MTNEELHRLLWKTISERIEDIQSIQFLKKEIISDLNLPKAIHDCYACEENNKKYHIPCIIYSKSCPIKWSNLSNRLSPCENEDSIYYRIKNSTNIQERKQLAKEIAELEWHENKINNQSEK